MAHNPSNYPPGVSGSEPQINGTWSGAAAWEAWAEAVKPGDFCQVGGTIAVVTTVTDEFLWAYPWRQGRTAVDAIPWDWEDCESLDPSEWPVPGGLS